MAESMYASDSAEHCSSQQSVLHTHAVLQPDQSLEVGGGVETAPLTANIDPVEGGGREDREERKETNRITAHHPKNILH